MSFPHNAIDLENEVVKGSVPFSIHKLSGFIDVVTAIDFVNPVDPILSLEYLDPQGVTCACATLPLSTYVAFLVQNFRIESGNAKLPSGTNQYVASTGAYTIPTTGYMAATFHNYGDGSGYYSERKKCSCGTDIALKGESNNNEMHSQYCDLYKAPKILNRKCDCEAQERNPEIYVDYLTHKKTCPAYK